MKEKQTKEQLLSEVSKLETQLRERTECLERVRKEFAKAFNWYRRPNPYGSENNEAMLPSWEQIFVEVGKLLAARTFYNLEGNVSELECKLEDLEKRLLKKYPDFYETTKNID